MAFLRRIQDLNDDIEKGRAATSSTAADMLLEECQLLLNLVELKYKQAEHQHDFDSAHFDQHINIPQ